MRIKKIKAEDAFEETPLLLGLQNSIFEVEKLLIKTIRERNFLANKYSDEDERVKSLTAYSDQLSLTLLRTNLYYFDQLSHLGEKAVYNAIVAKLDYHANMSGKHLKTIVANDFGWELENYFEEKNKIARCFKNLFSNSDRTVKTKTNELNDLAILYDFSYYEDCPLPNCPILPLSKPEDCFVWENGFALLVPGVDPISDPLNLTEIPQVDYECYTLFPPKPVINEEINLNDDVFEK